MIQFTKVEPAVPGGFFDGKVQSPPGTAGSTVWCHGFSGKNVVRLHG